MQSPKPSYITFESLQSDIRRGAVKIPQFQREFVWERSKSARLLDSILKSYPLGTFILWKTKERLRSVRNIGDLELPPAVEGDYVMLVLDGQQRMTSLFAALEGVKIGSKDFGEICVDLDIDPDGHEAAVYESPSDVPNGNRWMYFKELRSVGLFELMNAGYSSQQAKHIETYQKRIGGYHFPTVEIYDAPLAVATEIFTRLNAGGKRLSLYQIMVAKTWDEEARFDLNEKVEELNQELAKSGYGGIDHTILMQNNAALAIQSIMGADILEMPKSLFIENWSRSCDAIKQAADFCRSNLLIPVRALLPYQRALIPLAYYYSKAGRDPVGETKKKLIDLFFRIGLAERYSSATETKLAQDLRNVDLILEGKDCQYDSGVDVSAEFILRNGYFRAGKAYIKTLLCVLAAHQPKDFRTGGYVLLDNALLKQKNSRNYHHFFPISKIGKEITTQYPANHIANITLVGADLNKNRIRAKSPSQYIAEFSKENPAIERDLSSHLIHVTEMGVRDDDYDKFLLSRCEAMSRELLERVLPHPLDAIAPQSLTDTIVDEEVEEENPSGMDE